MSMYDYLCIDTFVGTPNRLTQRQCDPEAALAILSNPVLAAKTTLAPLDLTHQVIATEEVRRSILNGASDPYKDSGLMVRQMYHDLLIFFVKTYQEVFGLDQGSPVHDPVSVAIVLFDEGMHDLAFDDHDGERWDIDVTTVGAHEPIDYRKFRDANRAQLGRTVAALLENGEKGVRIPRGLNVDRFWDVVEECVQRAETTLLDQQRQDMKSKESPVS